MELCACCTWAIRGKRAAKLEKRGHYLPLHPPCIDGLKAASNIVERLRSSIRSRDLAMRHTKSAFGLAEPYVSCGIF